MGHPGLLVTLVEGSDHPYWCERRRSCFNPRPPETVSPPAPLPGRRGAKTASVYFSAVAARV
jgi:hypothetical protein